MNFFTENSVYFRKCSLPQARRESSSRFVLTKGSFYSTKEKKFVQVGSRLLAINALKPYPTWSGFKPKIKRAWNSRLASILEIRGLQRIGLRYINRIEILEPDAQPRDYFEFYLFLGPQLPQQALSFIAGSEFAYAEGRDRCRVQMTKMFSDSPDRVAFLLWI